MQSLSVPLQYLSCSYTVPCLFPFLLFSRCAFVSFLCLFICRAPNWRRYEFSRSLLSSPCLKAVDRLDVTCQSPSLRPFVGSLSLCLFHCSLFSRPVLPTVCDPSHLCSISASLFIHGLRVPSESSSFYWRPVSDPFLQKVLVFTGSQQAERRESLVHHQNSKPA